MSVWLFVAGVALVGVAFADLVWTTIVVSQGRGPLTNAVGYGLWRLAVRTGRHRVLQWTGYLVVLMVPLLWIALVWAGFVLMFLSEPGSAQQASPPYADASRVATVAYATGGLAGAGAGFVAGGPLWQLLNNLSALVGLALFTFVLTYLFQVVTAVSDQRALAARIAGLGDDPVDAVASALREEGLGQLPSNLVSITADLSGITHKRTALPILQFFHVGDRSQSIALNIAVLDEITTVLDVGLADAPPTLIRPARKAVDDYLGTTRLALTADPPPPPDLAPLPSSASDGGSASREIERLAERRATLHVLVRQEGWRWRDVYPETRPRGSP